VPVGGVRGAWALAIALTLAAVGGGLHAQQQTPAPSDELPPITFEVGVNYVEVDAIVTDAAGSPVTDLTAADFEVFEDGEPQAVESFALVDIPIERLEQPLLSETPIRPDVQTNAVAEGRIYLLVLDDWHTDVSRSRRVRDAARRFIQQDFGVNDMAAVVYTGKRFTGQEFTNDPQLLIEAIDRFTGQKLRSSVDNRLEAAAIVPVPLATEGLTAPVEAEAQFVLGADVEEPIRAHRARNMMAALRQLADFMAGVRGRRKAMVIIGEGIDYDVYAALGERGSTAATIWLEMQEAVAAATRGNDSIYTIDPRGQSNPMVESIALQAVGDDGVLPLMQEAQRSILLSQDNLRLLAQETGGFATLNRNDVRGAFERIVSENSTYYLLGFYSANARREGRFRDLEVRVRRQGATVRHRDGYYEARGDAPVARPVVPGAEDLSPGVAAALGSPLPVRGLPIRVAVASYRGADENAAVVITAEVDITNMAFEERDGTFNSQLEVAYSAVNSAGRQFGGEHHTVGLALRPLNYQRARERGVRLLTRLDLPPDRYQVRVAAGQPAGPAGSVLYDVTVPDLRKQPFTMSGVAMASAGTSLAPTVTPRDPGPLGGVLPGPFAATREFERGDVLVLFTEFYEYAPGSPAHGVDLSAELRVDGGPVVQRVRDERSSGELLGGVGGYGFNPRFDLADVVPGFYVIHLEGRSRFDPDHAAARDIPIRVR
jgi:VWFA-related protein